MFEGSKFVGGFALRAHPPINVSPLNNDIGLLKGLNLQLKEISRYNQLNCVLSSLVKEGKPGIKLTILEEPLIDNITLLKIPEDFV